MEQTTNTVVFVTILGAVTGVGGFIIVSLTSIGALIVMRDGSQSPIITQLEKIDILREAVTSVQPETIQILAWQILTTNFAPPTIQVTVAQQTAVEQTLTLAHSPVLHGLATLLLFTLGAISIRIARVRAAPTTLTQAGATAGSVVVGYAPCMIVAGYIADYSMTLGLLGAVSVESSMIWISLVGSIYPASCAAAGGLLYQYYLESTG